MEIHSKFWRVVRDCKNIFDIDININQKTLQKTISFRKKIHQNLKLITDSINNFQMNVAVAKIHELTSDINSFSASMMIQNGLKKRL